MEDTIQGAKINKEKLCDELVAILSEHCGEHGDNEGAVETLNRIIKENQPNIKDIN